MKLLTVALISLMTTSSFAAISKTCYSSINPQVIHAASDDGKQMWAAKSAGLILETVKDQYSAAGEQANGRMTIRTQGGPKIDIWSLVDPQLRTTLPTYSVECDGGRMTVVKKKNGLVIANSDRIRGDYKSATDEGCSNANVSFKNLTFKPVSCH